jgi:hypothetical protein
VSRQNALVLDIIEGINSGAVIDVEAIMASGAEGLRIGSDEENDIILADHDTAEHHAVLERVPQGDIFLTALAPGVRLGTRSITIGERRRWRQNTPLTIGSAKIMRRPPPPVPSSRLSRALSVMMAAGAIGSLVATGFYLSSGSGTAPVDTTAAFPVSTAKGMASAATQLTAQTQDLLLRHGLGAYVTIAPENGAVVARGTVPDGLASQWAQIQAAFDELPGSQNVLVNQVTIGASVDGPALKIGAVSMYPIPYVITTGGQRLTEGAMLAGGWEIESITAKEVIMRNGPHETHIAL